MLLLDAGNTRLKWALTGNSAWLAHGNMPIAQVSELHEALASLPTPERVLVSNVAGEHTARTIEAACASWDCAVEFVTAESALCGVKNGYMRPSQLGSDRWAALLAAWDRLHSACLVVNCGTATTIDALSEEGVFLGGLILPGLTMMEQNLAAGTAGLAAAPGRMQHFPLNTADAIHSGAIQATVGAIRLQHAQLNQNDAPCVLDGGAADLIHAELGLYVIREDDLVLKGLHLIGLNTGKALR